jgi:hypothetical protein
MSQAATTKSLLQLSTKWHRLQASQGQHQQQQW